jgi:predicted RNase H-like HicB family nuclease
MRRYYPAVIDFNSEAVAGTDGEIGGIYGVVFPDVPGCYSAGDTIDEAMANAKEALAGHLTAMVENGMEFPAASALADIRPDPEVTLAAIGLIEGPVISKPIRVNISMESDLLEQIDAVATNRSAFLAEGARALLAREADTGRLVGRSSDVVRAGKKSKRSADPVTEDIIRMMTKKNA